MVATASNHRQPLRDNEAAATLNGLPQYVMTYAKFGWRDRVPCDRLLSIDVQTHQSKQLDGVPKKFHKYGNNL
jgi:hypothetical protein